MKNTASKRLLTLFVLLILSFRLNAAGGHTGIITSLVHNGNTIISAAEDGFIEIWSVSPPGPNGRVSTAREEPPLMERFQLTPYRINLMVKNPLKDEICIVESYGVDSYRISAWNYRHKEKLFSLQSARPVTYVNYSAGGNFIIAAGFNGSHLALLDSVTGKIISTPEIPEGIVSLAITGKSERNMLLYQSENEDFEGQILYFDFASAAVTGRFNAPGDLSNPITFGNNRFLAGINSGGLLIVDAATGAILDSVKNIERSALLCPAGEEFYCLNRNSLYRFTVNRSGKLVVRQEFSLSFDASIPISSIAYNGFIVLAASDGDLLLPGQQGRISTMTHNHQERITEIAHTGKSIAFLTQNGELCFLPLDYRLLKENQKLTLALKSGYTRITGLSQKSSKISADQFILWQSAGTLYAPQIVYEDQQADESSFNYLPVRFPLRSISSKNNKLLALDTSGILSVFDLENMSAKASFTFSSIGTIEAAFVDSEHFILCRSVIRGNSPFLFINYKTGETVPFFCPAEAGITAYTGTSGNIYAAAVERDVNGVKTKVLNLSAAGSGIFEYSGEAAISIAESAFSLAIACGGEGAAIYGKEAVNFERTAGLPEKLLGCDDFFLSLDSEGNICWHNNKTGKLLAVFRLYEDKWVLSANREISGILDRPWSLP